LKSDKRNLHRRELCKALDEWSLREGIALQVHPLRRLIESEDFLGDEGRERVATDAQSWLHETGYDVLIWGVWSEAPGTRPSYNLRFAARDFGYREAAKVSIVPFATYVLREMKLLVALPQRLATDI